MEVVFRIGAMAGEGAFVMGRTIGRIFARGGYNVHGYPEYPSLVRGGHNSYTIVVSDEHARSPRQKAQVLLAVNREALIFHKDSMAENGVILYDSGLDTSSMKFREDIKLVPLPVSDVLKEAGAATIMKNIAIISAGLSALSYPLEPLLKVIEEEFSRKGDEVVNLNKKVAELMYNKDFDKANISLKPLDKSAKVYASGNEIAALGALAGGLGFYSAYPMTPASALLHTLVAKMEKDLHNVAVVQSEDEISAAQMAIGASYAGVRAMTGTSGGGFALMTEGVGMAALAETPIVFYIAQRTGPSTGMPTWTEQADLIQMFGASQGDFLRVILAPGTIEENYELTAEALNIAEKWQLPVILLTDKFLAESHFSMDIPEKVPEINRGKLITEDLPQLTPGTRYKRYALTEDGVSPRPIPGVKNGEHVATSYEHWEDSFTTEDFDMRVKQVDKRASKIKGLYADQPKPSVYGDGSLTLAVWGSHLNQALDAQKILKAEGINVRILHFKWLYPLDPKKVKEVWKEKTIMFENNSTGQFTNLLFMQTGIKPEGLALKYNGRPWFPEELVKIAKDAIQNGIKEEYKLKEEFENYEFFTPWRY